MVLLLLEADADFLSGVGVAIPDFLFEVGMAADFLSGLGVALC